MSKSAGQALGVSQYDMLIWWPLVGDLFSRPMTVILKAWPQPPGGNIQDRICRLATFNGWLLAWRASLTPFFVSSSGR